MPHTRRPTSPTNVADAVTRRPTTFVRLLARPGMPVCMSAVQWRDYLTDLPEDAELKLVSSFVAGHTPAVTDSTEWEREQRALFESEAPMRVDQDDHLDPRHQASLWSLRKCASALCALNMLENVVSVEVTLDLPTDHKDTMFGRYYAASEFPLPPHDLVEDMRALQHLTVVVGALDCQTLPRSRGGPNVLERFWYTGWCRLAQCVHARTDPIERLEIRYASEALVGLYDDFILGFALRATATEFEVDVGRDTADRTRWFFDRVEDDVYDVHGKLRYWPYEDRRLHDDDVAPKVRRVILSDFGSVAEEEDLFRRVCRLMHRVETVVLRGTHTFQPRLAEEEACEEELPHV